MINILIHGLGQNQSSWDRVKEELEKNNLIVKTPNIFNLIEDKPLNYDNLFTAFTKYCNQFTGPINLIGLSLGAILAIDYAIKFPERTNSLVLIGAPYKVPKTAIGFQNVVFRIMPNRMFDSIGVSKKNILSLMNSMKKITIFKKVPYIKCKVLILCGSKDQVNKKSARNYCEAIVNSQYKCIENSGHEVNIENPKELSSVLIDFLRNEYFS